MKRDIYGANMVTLKDVGDRDAGPTLDNDELQPVFYHQLPPGLHLEVIHSFSVVGALGLTVRGAVGTGLLDQENYLLWPCCRVGEILDYVG